MCPDFCIATGGQVPNVMWVTPHDCCCTCLQGLCLICIHLPLADEFQEPVDPRKQPLANQSADLQVSCLPMCMYCSFIIFLWCQFYQWFPILCSQKWIFKVFIFVIYCGNSDRDFASSVMTGLPWNGIKQQQAKLWAALYHLFSGENANEEKTKKTSWQVNFHGAWLRCCCIRSSPVSVKFLMSLNPHDFCEDEQRWLQRPVLPNLLTFQESDMNLPLLVWGSQGLSRPYIRDTVLLVLHVLLTSNMNSFPYPRSLIC